MAEILGEAVVQVKADLSALRKDFAAAQDDLKRGANEVEASVSASYATLAANVAKIMGGVFTVKQVIDFATESVNAFAEQELALTKLQAVITATGHAAGFTTAQLSAQAGELQKTTVFGDDAINSMQALLATFREIKGDQFRDATVAALNLSTIMGGDLRGAALQLGKALQDPEQGLMALRRSGISFNDTQQSMIVGLVNAGQMAEAQALILKEIRTEMEGAAVAAGSTFAGALAIAKNATGELSEQLGALLAGGLLPFIQRNTDATNKLTESGDAAFALAGVLQALLVPLNYLALAAITVSSAFQGAWSVIRREFDAVVLVVLGGINKLIQGFVSLVNFTTRVGDAVRSVLPNLRLIKKTQQDMADSAKMNKAAKAFGDYVAGVKMTAAESEKSTVKIANDWVTSGMSINRSFNAAATGIGEALYGTTVASKNAADSRKKHLDDLAIKEKDYSWLLQGLSKVNADAIISDANKRYMASKKLGEKEMAKLAATLAFAGDVARQKAAAMKAAWATTPGFFADMGEKIKTSLKEMMSGGTEEGAAWAAGLIATVGEVATATQAIISAVTDVLSVAKDVAGAILGVVGAMVGGVASLPGMIISNVQSIIDLPKQLMDGITGFSDKLAAAPNILGDLTSQLPEFLDTIIAAAPAFIESLTTNIPILITTLAEKLPELIPAFLSIVDAFLQALVDNAGVIVDMFITIALAFIDKVIEILPTLIPVLIDAAIKFIIALISRIPDVIKALVDALPLIIDGLIEALPAFIEAIILAVPQIIMALVNGAPKIILKLISAIPELMSKMAQGFWNAISKLLPSWLTDIFGGGGADTRSQVEKAQAEVAGAEQRGKLAMKGSEEAKQAAKDLAAAKQALADAQAAAAAAPPSGDGTIPTTDGGGTGGGGAGGGGAGGGGAGGGGAGGGGAGGGGAGGGGAGGGGAGTIDVAAWQAIVTALTDIIASLNATTSGMASVMGAAASTMADILAAAATSAAAILTASGETLSIILVTGVTDIIDKFIAGAKLFALTMYADMEPLIKALAILFIDKINAGIKQAMDDLGMLGNDIAEVIKAALASGKGATSSFAAGGLIGGSWNGKLDTRGDTELARVMPGEFIVPRTAVNATTLPALETMRRTGEVSSPGQGRSSNNITVNIGGSLVTESGLIDSIEEALTRRLRLEH